MLSWKQSYICILLKVYTVKTLHLQFTESFETLNEFVLSWFVQEIFSAIQANKNYIIQVVNDHKISFPGTARIMGIIFQNVDKLLTAYNTIMYLFSLSANFSSVLNTIGSHCYKDSEWQENNYNNSK